MTFQRFFVLLGVATAVAGILAFASHYFLAIDYAIPLTVLTILFFCAFCIGLFWLSQRAAGAENKYLFSNVFMGATLLKFSACGGFIAAYAILGEPENKLFVVPFFVSYLVYTVLEIVFLLRLAGVAAPVKPAE